VTDLHQIEQLILNSRNKFRALIDGLEDQMMSLDGSFQITSVNTTLAESTGRRPPELIGRFCFNVLYGFDRPCPEHDRPCPAGQSLVDYKSHVVHHDVPVNNDPEPRYIEIRSMPLMGHGAEDLEQVILIRRDVTLQRRTEIRLQKEKDRLEREVLIKTRELIRANEQLKDQAQILARNNDELLELQKTKQDLTNMVIHDLKGPLSEIQANLELMLTTGMDDLQREFIESARLGSDDLLRMITNLLDIGRIEENKLVLDYQPIDLDAFLKEAGRRFSSLAALTNVTISCACDEHIPPLFADRSILERVMNNLLSNALSFTPENGRIDMRARFDNGLFRLEVEDNGAGIDPDMHERIFRKFSQGFKHHKTSSGLGLAFCKLAVETHGGQIRVESELEKGSCFIIVLPLVEKEW
jgi:signal transduction histidine kinase